MVQYGIFKTLNNILKNKKKRTTVVEQVAANINWKEVTTDKNILSTKLHLYLNLRQYFTSVCDQPSLDSDIPTIKSL